MISDHTWSLSAVLNQYETAIKSVGDIIEDYDTDKLFPVLGFGKIEKKADQCFSGSSEIISLMVVRILTKSSDNLKNPFITSFYRCQTSARRPSVARVLREHAPLKPLLSEYLRFGH